MSAQVTLSEAAETPGSRVDRRLLIDGRLVTTDRAFPSINPATGEVIGHAPDAGVEEAEAVIAAARRGFKQSGVGREMGVAGLEEFSERTFAVPVMGGNK
ncbi:hypothetical protein AWC05_27995 [Mycobacterium florentinum]|uniref:Uncharacterized protein n=1 Tax=Mycobacterium florentinum TaxID=292462 RepID=A0A1X1U418_MYCFL|nr:hypothetical protein AWC05_27995 [Mycobacterium florentinum]BBX80596.1 hypothetical protein MFLOJ_43830 [Mycobacterium florentinum]